MQQFIEKYRDNYGCEKQGLPVVFLRSPSVDLAVLVATVRAQKHSRPILS